MDKLYTENQYKEYENFMDKMANTDEIIEGLSIHLELKDWIEANNLSEEVIEQMDKRLEEEFEKEKENQ